MGVAYHDVLDVAVSVDEHTYLAVDLARYLGELSGEVLGDYVVGMDALREEFLELSNLVAFEAVDAAFDVANSRLPSLIPVSQGDSTPSLDLRPRGKCHFSTAPAPGGWCRD
jgi:hypothetical protein